MPCKINGFRNFEFLILIENEGLDYEENKNSYT